jgi:hypothetical protein
MMSCAPAGGGLSRRKHLPRREGDARDESWSAFKLSSDI